MIKSIVREPLLHFLLIGAVLFLVFEQANDGASGVAGDRIVVPAGRIEQLSKIFNKTWQRPPTAKEIKGLVDDFVLEEIYYRRALAMGIDRDDTVIRRRLRQKFEFLTDDLAAASAATDEDLADYLTANADTFLRDTTYTFEQVHIDTGRSGPDLDSHVAERLAQLRTESAAIENTGLLPAYFEAAPARTVDRSFGLGFSKNLDTIPLGEWHGPVESGFGLHLVRLTRRVDGTVPDLADIRPIVEREWSNVRRIESRRQINEQLLSEFEVVIEWPTALQE